LWCLLAHVDLTCLIFSFVSCSSQPAGLFHHLFEGSVTLNSVNMAKTFISFCSQTILWMQILSLFHARSYIVFRLKNSISAAVILVSLSPFLLRFQRANVFRFFLLYFSETANI
jgi:hypothetical protein